MKTDSYKLIRLASLLLCTSYAQAINLSELETLARQHDPQTVIARLDTIAASARKQASEANSGWEWFANSSIGHSTETDPGSASKRYQSLAYSAGISHPLLGSQTRQQQAIAAAEMQAAQAAWNAQLVERQSLLALQQDYIALWQIEQLERLSQAFLAQADRGKDLLAKRRAEGLVLPSDEQVFYAQFHTISTRLDSAHQQAEWLRQRLAARTGLPPGQFIRLSAPPDSIANEAPAPDPQQQPQSLRAAEQWQHQQYLARQSKVAGIESSVYLSYAGQQKGTLGRAPNHNWQLGVQIRAPFELGKLQRAIQDSLVAELDSSARQYDYTLKQQAIDYRQALADYHAAIAESSNSRQFRQAAERSLQEKALRRRDLPGDVEEQWLAARFDYFQKANQQLSNLVRQQNTVALLAFYNPALINLTRQSDLPLSTPLENDTANTATIKTVIPPAPPMAANTPPANTAPARAQLSFALPTGIYLWDSTGALANPSGAIASWQRFGISRVLVGLNAAQINDPQLRAKFNNLARQSHATNIRLELLLGDASWINAGGRKQLIALLTRLRTLPVSGLNLDLEIEQLPNWQALRDTLTHDWLATLHAAANVSPWPVAATFHHRHLDDASTIGQLAAIGIRRADIMIFSTGAETVLNTASKARQALGSLPFSIAQSVEADLSDEESYARKGLSPLQALSARLAAQGNTSLLIQDWSQLQRMSK